MSPGKKLQAAREAKGIAVGDVSRDTRISAATLKGLEEEDDEFSSMYIDSCFLNIFVDELTFWEMFSPSFSESRPEYAANSDLEFVPLLASEDAPRVALFSAAAAAAEAAAAAVAAAAAAVAAAAAAAVAQ